MNFSLLLLSILACEAWLLVGLWFYLRQLGWSVWAATILPIALAIGWRQVIVTISFMLSRAWAKRSLSASLKLWLQESWVVLALYSLSMPMAIFTTAFRKYTNQAKRMHGKQVSNLVNRDLPNSDLPNSDLPGTSAAPVIVLVHGYLCNSGMWGPMLRALQRAGFTRNYVVSLNAFYYNMEANKAALLRRINSICEKEGVSSVRLIGHSMGGVLARIFLHQHEGLIDRIVCIGAPHAGTDAARLVASIHRGPARPDTRWLLEFNAACDDHSKSDRLLNIWSDGDNIVYPQANAALSSNDVHIPAVGHLALVGQAQTLQQTIRFLSP